MGRRFRHHLPGTPFHLTARLQGRAPWFRGMEDLVVARILAAPRRSDAVLLAYAVMPNHLHIVVLQGRQPLSQFMQPLLRRLAILVQKRTGAEGHIFERRFHSSPCTTADYLRNAIAYVHLNGVRAGLCENASEFAWSSHRAYCALADAIEVRPDQLRMESVLRLFAAGRGSNLRTCVADYCSFLEWRCAMDAYAAQVGDESDADSPEQPTTFGGDDHWLSDYACDDIRPRVDAPERADLYHIARATIEDMAPGMDLEMLRSGERIKSVVRVRRRFILRAVGAGHGGGVVARFLQVSPSSVSSIRTSAARDGR